MTLDQSVTLKSREIDLTTQDVFFSGSVTKLNVTSKPQVVYSIYRGLKAR
jgi:hypothetical protein